MEHQHRWRPALRVGKWLLCGAGLLVALFVVLLITFRALATIRENKLPSEAAPATGRFVHVDDGEIFIQEAGPESGAAVLLIHGTGAWSEIWRETMTALAENGFHAIAIDIPPFGYSGKPRGETAYSRERQAQRLIGLLDALDIDKAVFVGHSVGGRPTIEAAIENPERVQNLVLVDPALGFTANGKQFQQNDPSWLMRTIFAIPPLRNAVVAAIGTNPLFTKRMFASFVSDPAAVTTERVRTLQKPFSVEGATRGAADWLKYLLISQDTSQASNFMNFKTLSMPTLIIWGSTDTVTPLWQGEQLKTLIPNSELKTIDNVGHIPYIENPEKFNDILITYLATH